VPQVADQDGFLRRFFRYLRVSLKILKLKRDRCLSTTLSAGRPKMNGLVYEHLHHNLKLLKLLTFESILDNYLEFAAKEVRKNSHNFHI
jgi:hypothetical protein